MCASTLLTLASSFEAGDRICIFGFSRGAFTARALAGMIHCVSQLAHFFMNIADLLESVQVGLLPRHNIGSLSADWSLVVYTYFLIRRAYPFCLSALRQ